MPFIWNGVWTPNLIPRKTLQAYRITEQTDSRNRVIESTETPYTITNASVQPSTGKVQQTLPQGLRDKVAYHLITTTELRTVIEGSEGMADRVEYEGDRYLILNVKPCKSGVLNHYQAMLVKESDYELE